MLEMRDTRHITVEGAAQFIFACLDIAPEPIVSSDIRNRTGLRRQSIPDPREVLLNHGCLEKTGLIGRSVVTAATPQLVTLATSYNELFLEVTADHVPNGTSGSVRAEALEKIAGKYTPGIVYDTEQDIIEAAAKAAHRHPQTMWYLGFRSVAALAGADLKVDAAINRFVSGRKRS